MANPSREDLQNLGQQLVQTDILNLCRAVFKSVDFSSGDRLVVDGVRHLEALNAISTISAGQPIKLIYLHASMKVRESKKRWIAIGAEERSMRSTPIPSRPRQITK